MTGCTTGKGNLVHQDTGRHVYTFVRKATGEGVRVTVKPAYWDGRSPEHKHVQTTMQSGQASEGDRKRFQELQVQRGQELLRLPQADLLRVEPVKLDLKLFRSAPNYAACDGCGALTLVNRMSEVNGKRVCAVCAAD